MNPKQPDVVIAFEGSTFSNPAFKPPDVPAARSEEPTLAVPVENAVPIRFNNPQQGAPQDTASCFLEVVTPSGVYFSSHSTQTVILDPMKGET